MELSALKGIGPTRLETLRAMGINSLRDLLYTLPVRYEDHTRTVSIDSLEELYKSPADVMIRGSFRKDLTLSRFKGLTKITGSFTDGTGTISVCWYNQPWVMQQYHTGEEYCFYGRFAIKNGRKMLQSPGLVTETGYSPIYKAIHGIPAKTFRELISKALEEVDDCCPESLPKSIRIEYRLCELNFAIRQAHFPTDEETLRVARRRLSFEKALLFQTYINSFGSRKIHGYPMNLDNHTSDQFWERLPFPPTGAQKRVLNEILTDMKKNNAMSRLIQGDVGCGKTVIAFGAIEAACRNGYQAAMMAPTEILAEQHYLNAKEILEPAGIQCCLLTGSTKAKERKAILQALEDGSCQAVFGTHALISKSVNYQKLGLVITDEQHRFGVRQRSELQNKGKSGESAPHVLVMSATPIPRTLALILYGDLDISIVDELPPGRIPVKTRLVRPEKMADMYGFVKKKIEEGQQIYIVCPLVEDSEVSENVRSATSQYEELKDTVFSGITTGLVYGNQKENEKEETIRAFKDGQISVLFSTTVIEVGVNVPNACIMIIQNAERFGLSQLHQLRGRVGRGRTESWCFLAAEPSEKLNVFCSTNDGFVIAEKDLEIRGPGELAGTRQSGSGLDTALLGTDVRILEESKRCLDKLRKDPGRADDLKELENAARAVFANVLNEISMN